MDLVLNYLYNDFLPVKIASWAILVLLISAALLFILVFRSRIIKSRKLSQQTRYSRKYEQLLTEFIFDEETYAPETEAYRKLVLSLRRQTSRYLPRRVFAKVILLFHRDFKGQSEERLAQLYRDMGMPAHGFKDLRQGSWYQKAFIFTELGQMGINEGIKVVMSYANHYNSVLREEAQFAAVRMGGAVNINFMVKLKVPVSGWQQTRIMQELDRVNLNEIPSFYYLLDSENPSVVAFGLKLLAKYRQIEDVDKMVSMLNHPNIDVKLATLGCIKETEVSSCIPFLIEQFPNQILEVQEAILDTLGYIGDQDTMAFLEQFLRDENYRTGYPGMKALVRLGYKLAPNLNLPIFNKELYKHTRYELFSGQ